MKRITNIIEVECESFSLDVKYWYKKLNEQEDEVDIKRVYINSYTTQGNEVIVINKRLLPASGNELPSSWEEIIVQEISNDIENFI
jgi:hypothetical protein